MKSISNPPGSSPIFPDTLDPRDPYEPPPDPKLHPDNEVLIDYTNWRGERGIRRVIPLDIDKRSTKWHPGRQWLMRAYDVEKKANRDFALESIHGWFECTPRVTSARPMVKLAMCGLKMVGIRGEGLDAKKSYVCDACGYAGDHEHKPECQEHRACLPKDTQF